MAMLAMTILVHFWVLYPIYDTQILMILTIKFDFFVHVRRSIGWLILTYPRPMVSHMDLYYVLQGLVR
jgi:hypothetical protein